jgi:hypothetical protein
MYLANQSAPSITMDDIGNFNIAWGDFRNNNFDIFCRRFLYDATPVGNSFRVNSDSGNSYQSFPCISAQDNGNFIVTWWDKRNGTYDVFAQRYLSDGFAYGANFQIPNTTEMEQSFPSVILKTNRFYTAWQDNRGGQTGYDIWANVLDWDIFVGVKNNQLTETPPVSRLFQNYPNPFYLSTTIKFDLPAPAKVKLEIFNHLGQKIETPIDISMSTGSYQIEFKAGNLSNGIYFYRLVTKPMGKEDAFEQVKGMVMAR